MKAVDEGWDTRLGTVLAKKIFFFFLCGKYCFQCLFRPEIACFMSKDETTS